jgi:hypothetical protein
MEIPDTKSLLNSVSWIFDINFFLEQKLRKHKRFANGTAFYLFLKLFTIPNKNSKLNGEL